MRSWSQAPPQYRACLSVRQGRTFYILVDISSLASEPLVSNRFYKSTFGLHCSQTAVSKRSFPRAYVDNANLVTVHNSDTESLVSAGPLHLPDDLTYRVNLSAILNVLLFQPWRGFPCARNRFRVMIVRRTTGPELGCLVSIVFQTWVV